MFAGESDTVALRIILTNFNIPKAIFIKQTTKETLQAM
jgi:hypothetical protein